MILAILSVSALCFFLFAVLSQRGVLRRIMMVVFGALIILSAAGIAANDVNHFGMVQKTTLTTAPLVGAKQEKVLLAQPLGTAGKENSYLYRTNPLSTKVLVAKPGLHATTAVVDGQKAQVRRSVTRWRYSGTWSAFLFCWSGQENSIASTDVTFVLPSDWQVVNAK
ncbi:DUF4811 domain-containing protein [Lacticaseibacillus mingshuiensis]|uniref:DUF4811 domain-containing protein n=1 Tax=Lacticaseibacillus mingshuiensis TaxID=2799574 RepID=UPI00194E4424|nr:DUF4811 domain-containing protein [Lacticaseibacillus mingshuiensis]